MSLQNQKMQGYNQAGKQDCFSNTDCRFLYGAWPLIYAEAGDPQVRFYFFYLSLL